MSSMLSNSGKENNERLIYKHQFFDEQKTSCSKNISLETRKYEMSSDSSSSKEKIVDKTQKKIKQ